MSPKSVAIVGGGVIGACTALYAARDGFDVTVIERDPTLSDSCSLGNAGLIVPSHFVPLAAPGMVRTGLRMMLRAESPFCIRPRLDPGLAAWAVRFARASFAAQVERAAPVLLALNLLSRTLYEDLARQPDWDFGLELTGLLALCRTERALHEEARTATMAGRLGLPAQILSAAQTAEKETGVAMDVAGAVYYPTDGHLTPGRFMGCLRRAIDAEGVHIVHATADGWRSDGRRISAVVTSAGDVEADSFVLAGGAWSSRLARPLGVRLTMQAGKGYSVTMPDPAQLPRIPSLLVEARVAVTPMGRALRFGGTMEIAGFDRGITESRLRGIFRSVPRYLPAFGEADFRELPVWAGLRPVSPDGLPYIGYTLCAENLIVATGHAMMGMSLGPATGRIVTDLLTDRTPAVDLTLLSPDRYG